MVGRSKAVPWDARIETMREQMLAPPFHHRRSTTRRSTTTLHHDSYSYRLSRVPPPGFAGKLDVRRAERLLTVHPTGEECPLKILR